MLVARFASAEALRGWEDSSERAEWLRRAEPLTEGAPAHHRLSGIEGWFALPGRVVSAPKRWKTAVVTFPLICPVVLAVTGWWVGSSPGFRCRCAPPRSRWSRCRW